ncbi:prepilin peptidase [uncultured Methylobacterium sp.]|uniref:prepilin peptidase n=1 Tax=uncultured Methylobacterium sp. TaxID=157278 RepID=UPI0035CB202A
MILPSVSTNAFAGPVIGVAAAGSALAAWLGPGPAATAAMTVALGLVGARIVWQDLTDFTIPDAATLALGLLGLTSRISEGAVLAEPMGTVLGLALLDAALCGGVLLALRELYYRTRGRDGVGLGDVKLAAVGGLLLGTNGLSWAILGASLAGLAAVLAARAWPGALRWFPVTDRIAFGAVLAPSLWATWLLGQIAPTGLSESWLGGF